MEQDEIRLYFNDVSLFDKLISGCSEKGLTEKLYCLYVVCGKELLPGILSTVHASRRVGTYLLLYDRYCVFSRNTQILYKEASIEQMPVLY